MTAFCINDKVVILVVASVAVVLVVGPDDAVPVELPQEGHDAGLLAATVGAIDEEMREVAWRNIILGSIVKKNQAKYE